MEQSTKSSLHQLSTGLPNPLLRQWLHQPTLALIGQARRLRDRRHYGEDSSFRWAIERQSKYIIADQQRKNEAAELEFKRQERERLLQVHNKWRKREEELIHSTCQLTCQMKRSAKAWLIQQEKAAISSRERESLAQMKFRLADQRRKKLQARSWMLDSSEQRGFARAKAQSEHESEGAQLRRSLRAKNERAFLIRQEQAYSWRRP